MQDLSVQDSTNENSLHRRWYQGLNSPEDDFPPEVPAGVYTIKNLPLLRTDPDKTAELWKAVADKNETLNIESNTGSSMEASTWFTPRSTPRSLQEAYARKFADLGIVSLPPNPNLIEPTDVHDVWFPKYATSPDWKALSEQAQQMYECGTQMEPYFGLLSPLLLPYPVPPTIEGFEPNMLKGGLVQLADYAKRHGHIEGRKSWRNHTEEPLVFWRGLADRVIGCHPALIDHNYKMLPFEHSPCVDYRKEIIAPFIWIFFRDNTFVSEQSGKTELQKALHLALKERQKVNDLGNYLEMEPPLQNFGYFMTPIETKVYRMIVRKARVERLRSDGGTNYIDYIFQEVASFDLRTEESMIDFRRLHAYLCSMALQYGKDLCQELREGRRLMEQGNVVEG